MIAAHGNVSRHTGAFRYGGKNIHFTYWSHVQNGKKPDTVLFLGTGQTGRIGKWAAQAAPPGVIVVEGAPHWHAHPSARDLYDFMYAYTLAAYREVQREFAVVSMHVAAQSQAAPGVVKLGNTYPDAVGNTVLITPLGFAATLFGDTPAVRMRTLMRRARQTSLQFQQSLLYDPKNAYAGLMILRAILRESERGAARRKYAAGLSYDMLGDFRVLVKRLTGRGKTVTLLLGGKDKMFRVAEIRPLILSAGITGANISILPGMSHGSLGARGGKKAVRTAVEIARSPVPT